MDSGGTRRRPPAATGLTASGGSPQRSPAIAEAIGFAIAQPSNVDVNELIVRPTAQG